MQKKSPTPQDAAAARERVRARPFHLFLSSILAPPFLFSGAGEGRAILAGGHLRPPLSFHATKHRPFSFSSPLLHRIASHLPLALLLTRLSPSGHYFPTAPPPHPTASAPLLLPFSSAAPTTLLHRLPSIHCRLLPSPALPRRSPPSFRRLVAPPVRHPLTASLLRPHLLLVPPLPLLSRPIFLLSSPDSSHHRAAATFSFSALLFPCAAAGHQGRYSSAPPTSAPPHPLLLPPSASLLHSHRRLCAPFSTSSGRQPPSPLSPAPPLPFHFCHRPPVCPSSSTSAGTSQRRHPTPSSATSSPTPLQPRRRRSAPASASPLHRRRLPTASSPPTPTAAESPSPPTPSSAELPLLLLCCSCAGPGIEDYSGKIGAADTDGVDTAYRLLADHIRMIAVTNAPGSQLGLGHEGREYFLKCADKQAVQYGHKVLKTNEEDYDVILEGILQNEADLCPELEGYRIMDKIVEDEVMIYKKTIAELQDQELPFDMGEKKKKKKKKDVTSVVWYATRVIEFLGRRTLIILKNKDTRCSLVALCNVLLLGEKITLNLDIKKVSEGHLIYLVQSYLLCGNTQMQLDQNLEL